MVIREGQVVTNRPSDLASPHGVIPVSKIGHPLMIQLVPLRVVSSIYFFSSICFSYLGSIQNEQAPNVEGV